MGALGQQDVSSEEHIPHEGSPTYHDAGAIPMAGGQVVSHHRCDKECDGSSGGNNVMVEDVARLFAGDGITIPQVSDVFE